MVDMSLFFNCLLIFFVRIIDVSLGTVRTMILIRGHKLVGSIIGFIEITVWFLVVRSALTEATNYWIVFAYAAGFATGNFVGTMIEGKLAIGNASVQVITRGIREDLVKKIRDAGFAVSTVKTEGKDGTNLLLIIEINRKKIETVKTIIREVAPDSFVTVSDIRQVYNGYV